MKKKLNLQSELIHSLTKMRDEKDMTEFLSGILTPKELEELPKRLEIFRQLKKGVPQHAIADEVGVGVATVTRGSLELQRGHIQQTSWWRNLSVMGG